MPRLRIALLAPLLPVAISGLSVACGPSYQALYEGDVRFERCYALDEDPSRPMRERTDCWGEWLRNYTYGQTRDRVEYARGRRRALAAMNAAPTDEALMAAAPGEGRSSKLTPAPTNAFAPPPKTMEDLDGGPAPAALSDAGSASPQVLPVTTPDAGRAPLAACTETCGATWTACTSGCVAQVEAKKACDACERAYKACVRTCAK